MPKIHLIEKIDNLRITNKENNEWDSYSWEQKAKPIGDNNSIIF